MQRLIALLLLAVSPAVFAVEAGTPMPSLTAPRLDVANQTLDLASLKGNVVYVDFWASWCTPCRLSFPALEAIYKDDQSRGLVVLGIGKDSSVEDAQKFMRKIPVSFPLVSDFQDSAAKAFNVKTMPSGYLIDRKGFVRKVHRGFTEQTGAEIRREIESLLNEPS